MDGLNVHCIIPFKSLKRGLVHNLVSIIPNYDLYNLQKIEDNIDYFGL